VPQASSGHNGFAERFAYAVLSRLSGHTLSPEPITMAMFRREAALHLLNKHNAEILLKARSLGIGFAVTVMALPGVRVPARRGTRLERLAKAIRLATSIGGTPVRVLGTVSIAASLLSLVYALYVVMVFLFKTNVEAGWTTISLQLAGM